MSSSTLLSRARWAPWTVLLTLAVLWTVRLGDRLLDDFYITYTYAKHLAERHGFVFNLGERVFGLTEPGLGLLLAAAQRLMTLPVHRIGLPLGALALVALIAVVQRNQAARGASEWIALAGGAVALSSSFVWINAAGAWPFVLLALALAAHLLPRRPYPAGVLAGLAVWLRPDALLGLGLLGLLHWIEARKLPWRFALAAALVVVLGLGAAWWYFGQPIPNTLGAKLAAGASDDAATAGLAGFWPRAVPLLGRHLGPAWPALIAVGAVGAVLGWRKSGLALRTLIAFAAALSLAYPLLGVPFYPWYAAPPLFVAFLGFAQAMALTFAAVRRRASVGLAATAAVLVALVPLLSLASASSRFFRSFAGYPHLETYRLASTWLRENTPLETRITYFEIGVLGYFSERPIRDLMGLVTPDALPYLRRSDYRGAFLAAPTEVVLHHPHGRLSAVVQKRWFLDAYEVVATFRSAGEAPGRGLTIFRLRPGSPLPSEQLKPATTP